MLFTMSTHTKNKKHCPSLGQFTKKFEQEIRDKSMKIYKTSGLCTLTVFNYH